jgi:hypothetical protein
MHGNPTIQRTGFDEHRHAIGTAPVHAVQHEAM